MASSAHSSSPVNTNKIQHSINLSLGNLITLPPVAENHPTIGGENDGFTITTGSANELLTSPPIINLKTKEEEGGKDCSLSLSLSLLCFSGLRYVQYGRVPPFLAFSSPQQTRNNAHKGASPIPMHMTKNNIISNPIIVRISQNSLVLQNTPRIQLLPPRPAENRKRTS